MGGPGGWIKALEGSAPPPLRRPWERSSRIQAQTMSQLVECVPNFSEGNNQEVSAGAAGHRAWGEEEGVCLAWGWGVSSLE